MRTKLKMAAGWLHATLIFSLFFPTVYAIGMENVSREQVLIYVLNLFILIPVIVTEISILRCRGLIGYLFFSGLSICIAGFLVFGIGKAFLVGNVFRDFNPISVSIVILVEGIYITIYRFLGRLHNRKMEMVYEDSEESKEGYEQLTSPSVSSLVFFFVSYMIGKFFGNAFLCNEAFFSCIFYFFIMVIYRYLKTTEDYLFLNQTIENVPRRRIYGISKNLFLIFVLFLLLSSLPSILLISNREYYNAREMVSGTPYSAELWENMETESSSKDDELYQYLQEMAGESLDLPWLEPLTKVFLFLILLAIGGSVIKSIHRIQHSFREAYDENGDIVENLEKVTSSDLVEEKIVRKKWDTKNMSPKEKIRYRYYLFIKKYRKELPLPHETPYEIEKKAQIADLEETKELHLEYERARYGK